MALSLSRPKHRPLPTSPLIHLFSSSSTPPPDPSPSENPNISQPQSPQQSSLTSYFSDVKASLKQKQHHQQQSPGRENRFDSPPPHPPRKPTPSKVSLDEIRKNLSEFRLLSSAPDPIGPNSTSKSRQQEQFHKPISFQELYKRNVVAKSGDGGVGDPELSPNVGNLNKPVSGKLSFETIRESLRQMRSNSPMNTGKRTGDAMSLAALRTSLKQSGNEPVRSTVIGGTELPKGLFGKEIRKDEGSEKEKERMSTEFLKMYKYEELGEKLRNLRPEVRIEEKGWFSLQELNERLRKLREVEEKEAELSLRGFNDIRESLWKMKVADEEQYKKNSMSRLNILAQIGVTPTGPPKEHLVEKYLHPDNMSSADKMKIELAKVRDQFKMSESDCGSARVQVAQLTTKIKHLSSALHKKDKHSRKGLQGMVQKRKKLLKYLRRTDWDSYCFVISKLGLRDNPDYKN